MHVTSEVKHYWKNVHKYIQHKTVPLIELCPTTQNTPVYRGGTGQWLPTDKSVCHVRNISSNVTNLYNFL